MSLPKKKSRLVDVDGQPYRFIVRESYAHLAPSESELMVTVQREDDQPGRVLQFCLSHGSSVTPGLIQSIVRQAFQAGWNPSDRGSAFQLTNFAI